MRKVTLFIAMSLDGYIADQQGGVDWLQGESSNKDDMITYYEFIKNIDSVIMGWTTYHQLISEISPNEWMYADLNSYIITSKQKESHDNIKFVSKSPVELVDDLLQEEGKGIWICGGANIAQQLMNADKIDQYYISVVPVLLGKGIRLFENIDINQKLTLKATKNYNGIVDLIYERRT